ncbi:LacI family DNA-binding transcriptional regulator [Flavihumibacter sp. UBA7668]|uniref:LacI family DNA-binding transcriptional regulator n=1 Tax=Flavihumibacter sp. UBA7668 TaxID=1946542 RepID=UPI0025B93232|nr:LacI family DNA-binding transcriptional regulator [Flavihumibacter sp. UBA7668]
MQKHQVTIIDIARKMGISKSTVSRALTNNANIKPETREAVIRVANEMDYQPNMLALGLIKNETRMLGVIIPDIEKPFFASIVSGIQHAAARMNYRIIIAQSDESPEIEKENIKALMLSRVDGFLICHTRDTRDFEQIKQLHSKGVPLVSFARICQELPIPKVVEDDFNGLFTTTQHLIERGKKRIALFAGPKHLLASRLRLNGYKTALQQHNIPFNPKLVKHSKFLTENVEEAMEYWLNLPEPPDGICTVYDGGAIKIIEILKRKGIKIPEQIAVTGFGNDSWASIIDPGLTTYEQKPFEIGQIAGKFMLELLTKGKPSMYSQLTISKGSLIVRQSS